MKIPELENIPGIVTSKRPSVHWNFLFKTLEALNFGPQFQQWNNNGYASAFLICKEVFVKGAHSLVLFFVQSMDPKQVASWAERRVSIQGFSFEAAFQGKLISM